jgi:phospholipid transport system transporter-binding protein
VRKAQPTSGAPAFEFAVLGGGRFAINGVLGFATVTEILERSKELFDDHPVIKIDFSGVTKADSAGLALLLEWINWAKHYQREVRYFNVPKQVQAIAHISEVEDLLHAGERWTGPVN